MTADIFAQIIDRQIPATIIDEDDDFVVFKDIHPVAPVHVLIVPKIAYQTLEEIELDDQIQFRLIKKSRQIAKKLGINQNYKIHLNVGKQVQQVPHLHLHLLGGWDKPALER